MDILLICFWLVSLLFVFISIFFFAEIILSWTTTKKNSFNDDFTPNLSVSAKAAILVPAHNEEDVLADTLGSIIPQLRQGDELIVIADNCSDRTSEIAKSFNVTVLDRFNEDQKGKGFALDYALQFIKDKDFEVVLMVDADCIVEDKVRDMLVEEALNTNRPIQALYLMHGNAENPTFSQKISEFAWLIKNKLRPLGLFAIGGPCNLMGTGMAFPTKELLDIDLANGCIVEDMKLGLDFALLGKAPKFLPDALVWSRFPESEEFSEGQKSRWIHGHLEMMVAYAPKLVKAAFLRRDLTLFLLCCELLIPPLVLFFIMGVFLFLFTSLLSMTLGTYIFLLGFMGLIFISLSVFIAWFISARSIISLADLLAGLKQRIKSSSVYLKFFTNKRRDWNKTSRK